MYSWLPLTVGGIARSDAEGLSIRFICDGSDLPELDQLKASFQLQSTELLCRLLIPGCAGVRPHGTIRVSARLVDGMGFPWVVTTSLVRLMTVVRQVE